MIPHGVHTFHRASGCILISWIAMVGGLLRDGTEMQRIFVDLKNVGIKIEPQCLGQYSQIWVRSLQQNRTIYTSVDTRSGTYEENHSATETSGDSKSNMNAWTQKPSGEKQRKEKRKAEWAFNQKKLFYVSKIQRSGSIVSFKLLSLLLHSFWYLFSNCLL